MIAKKREYPLRAELDKVLLKYLPQSHPKRAIIDEDRRAYESGYRGEQALDYYLSFLPEEEYTIFQALRLPYKTYFFQIDFLLLTSRFALIIEAKNLAGILYFDKNFDQLIQTYREKEKVHENPISQAKRQQQLLRKWLQQNTSLNIPVDFLVAMANPNAILKTDPGHYEVLAKVCKPHKLTDKIAAIEKQHPKEVIDKKLLKKLTKLLLKQHTPNKINILEAYKISKNELITGVSCPNSNCGFTPMTHTARKWHCPACQTTSPDAHLGSIHDYFLLIGDSITNAELRWFLHLPSRNAAQKILAKLNLPSTGQTKGKVYYKAGDRHEPLVRR